MALTMNARTAASPSFSSEEAAAARPEHSAHCTATQGASSANEKVRPASPKNTSGAASAPAEAMAGRDVLRRSLQTGVEQWGIEAMLHESKGYSQLRL